MTPVIEQGLATAQARLTAKNDAAREEGRVTLIAVGEMMLNYHKLAFARWLYQTRRISDYDR